MTSPIATAKIIATLAAEGPMRARDLAERLGYTYKYVGQHLATLTAMGAVQHAGREWMLPTLDDAAYPPHHPRAKMIAALRERGPLLTRDLSPFAPSDRTATYHLNRLIEEGEIERARKGIYRIPGDTRLLPQYTLRRRGHLQERILTKLQEHGAMQTGELARQLRRDVTTFSGSLHRLIARGEVVRVAYGVVALAGWTGEAPEGNRGGRRPKAKTPSPLPSSAPQGIQAAPVEVIREAAPALEPRDLRSEVLAMVERERYVTLGDLHRAIKARPRAISSAARELVQLGRLRMTGVREYTLPLATQEAAA